MISHKNSRKQKTAYSELHSGNLLPKHPVPTIFHNTNLIIIFQIHNILLIFNNKHIQFRGFALQCETPELYKAVSAYLYL